jgi:cysteine-S-conjugate beta-lyase
VDDRLTRGSAKWTTYPPDVLPAWVAEMDFPLAEPVKAALGAAVANDDAGYLGARPEGLIEAFAGFAARRLGWTVDPAQVRPVTDVMVGVEELLAVLTEPGAGVVINPPVYPPFFADVRHSGRTVVEVPLREGGGLDVDGIADAFAAGAQALLLCNPHNPTGRVPWLEELAGIADAAAAHDAWVISDEIHAPLTLPGRRPLPFLEVSDAARARGVAVTSASKAFNLAGLKLGLIVSAGGQVERLPEWLHWRAGYLGAVAAEAAFRAGDAWLDGVVATIAANHALLEERLPAGIGFARPDASFLAWLDCRSLGLGDDPAAAFLSRGRVALSRGLDFGAQGAGYARLNVGTTPERVEEAVRRLAAASTG